MAYDLSAINDFIKRENEVLTQTLFSSNDTATFAKYMNGIKGSTEILKVTGAATLQPGTHNTPSGTTSGETITLSVKPFTFYESFKQDDLQFILPNSVLAPGSNNSETPKDWEEALVSEKLASIAEQLEVGFWTGDTGAGGIFDGFLKKIDAEATVINGNPSAVTVATGIDVSNVKALVEGMRDVAPAKVKRSKDFSVFVGDDIFDLYIKAEKAANLYHFAPEHNDGKYRIGGSGMTLQRVYGLNETDRMVATVGANLIIGTDVQNEDQVADMWYDKTSDLTYMRVKAKAGVQIINPAEMVEFTLV